MTLSESMLQEDGRMKAARKREDDEYQKKIEEEREQDIKSGDTDIKFQKLQYLIGQSKVHLPILCFALVSKPFSDRLYPSGKESVANAGTF